ncbi:MAG: NFYB/HAP3 family transcription factor subunit [Candidatus Aenigmarchaeota archaeon]|nr:NFYB/HAP3 family transcription factor subunit [Candidatus Aenigmarchaeota archaeon]
MLSLLSFERIAKKVGVKRISKEALEEIRDTISEEGLEIAERAFKISRHANRKTVMIEDVKFIMRHEKK